ncbi:gephyrin-like molybdotransferase Glp [Vulcanisaeta distributa]|uniref:Molybdenum cofactor synthesis domain protein n=1 Tax=Vulcanisaeta distributa (strain DSM 14429 / JCM 11212 / NBRC 100878 / IC-017) TaxID=572478 RepID=E1QPR9_VULDI|nr:gephyrin-like molybdotransferase Glp [Vulcanisaeta distributa]ADN50365.1 molybdenum cofactor synthesis domain protein [Vulcanisaeta distributa DSM 14429]
MGFKETKTVDQVLSEAIKYIKHVPRIIEVTISEALNKYIAEDVMARFDVPGFNRSAVDGYAVRSIDTFGASPTNPITLRVVGFMAVGDDPGKYSLNPGEAIEISTGAPLPVNADAVVMYEDTRRSGDYIEVLRPVPPMGNVSRRGEDVRANEVMYRRGMKILPWDLGVLASMGIYRIKVFSPRVAIISTGNELVEVTDVSSNGPPPGKVINSSRFVIEGLLKSLGCEPNYLGIVGDNEDEIAKTVSNALKDYDAVITTGGVSVGKVDYTIRAVSRLNPEYLNHGLSIRPGRPNSIAVVNGKPVFMLSGFPVAAATGFDVLVRPILLHMMGAIDDPKPVIKGVLTRRVSTPVNTKSFVRVRAYLGRDGRVYVEPLALTGSGILSTLVRGNGILVVPENREGFDEGDEVEVTLIRPLFMEGS